EANKKAHREKLEYERELLEVQLRAKRVLALQVQCICSAVLNLVLVLVLGVALGSFWGVNYIADGVLCFKANQLCNSLRVRSPKVVH
ncbi:MAG TPA: hypothetical protein V6D19_08060, partial [Stenomitos sp.]